MPSNIIRMPARRGASHDAGGIKVCCCRVFTCLHLEFACSTQGLFKLIEVILGLMCQTLLLRFGMPAAADIGQAFDGFLTTASSCLLTSSVLLFCYIISQKTFHLVRQSIFEVVFNAIACFMYLSAASYMGFSVNVWLWPRWELQRAYSAYPAMTAVYYSGFLLGIVYGLDSIAAYKYAKGS